MKKVMAILLLFMLCLLFTGCNEESKEISGTQTDVMKFIEEKYGMNSLVKWESLNGELIQVTVSFEWLSTAGETVANLEKVVSESISQFFDPEPRVIVIQIIRFDKKNYSGDFDQ